MYIVGSKAVNPPDVSQSDDNPLRVSKKANRHDFYEIATVSTLLLSLQRHKTTTPPHPLLLFSLPRLSLLLFLKYDMILPTEEKLERYTGSAC